MFAKQKCFESPPKVQKNPPWLKLEAVCLHHPLRSRPWPERQIRFTFWCSMQLIDMYPVHSLVTTDVTSVIKLERKVWTDVGYVGYTRVVVRADGSRNRCATVACQETNNGFCWIERSRRQQDNNRGSASRWTTAEDGGGYHWCWYCKGYITYVILCFSAVLHSWH